MNFSDAVQPKIYLTVSYSHKLFSYTIIIIIAVTNKSKNTLSVSKSEL